MHAAVTSRTSASPLRSKVFGLINRCKLARCLGNRWVERAIQLFEHPFSTGIPTALNVRVVRVVVRATRTPKAIVGGKGVERRNGILVPVCGCVCVCQRVCAAEEWLRCNDGNRKWILISSMRYIQEHHCPSMWKNKVISLRMVRMVRASDSDSDSRVLTYAILPSSLNTKRE